MNFSTQAKASPSDCFSAQTIPGQFGNDQLNPDVGGAAVALSNIVINVSLPILLRWAHEDIHTTVLMLLSQVYPILLATAASINTNNLSLFDAHFAVAVTASPVSAYLAYSAARAVFYKPNTLFLQLTYGKTLIRWLGLALPVLWFAINLTISFSPRAFRNSPQHCQKMTLIGWLEFQAVSNFIGVLDVMGRRDLWNDLEGRGGLGAISLALMWIWAVYLVRHRYDILNEIRLRRERQTTRNFFLRKLFLVWTVFSASWHVVTRCHPWTIIAIVFCLHWSWVLGIAKGMIMVDYELSYGQIMSLFSIVPPLMSVGKLLRDKWDSLLAFLRNLPDLFSEGVRFLLTGSPNPWPLPLDPISISALEKYWPADVKAGSIPNPRTPVNDPHNAWKPFSVATYIYGYCVCWLNILVWTAYFDRYPPSGGFPKRVSCSSLRTVIRETRGRILRQIQVLLLPVAFLMCAGPLFVPFAALPLAQQWQWTHFCDSFAGEVILSGLMNPSPTASFYYPIQPNASVLEYYFDYSLVSNTTVPPGNPPSQLLVFNARADSSIIPPDIFAISYDVQAQEISADCANGPCAFGNYSTKPYLSFTLQDSRTGLVTQLRAVDKEWKFPDDAPSVVLRNREAGESGGIALQSAVTQRDHCENLKVCVSSRTPDFATLAPLGVLLMAQQTYADYCLRPRIYSI
ncbi:hypothetical protein M413DRAFT_20642 [Hebeloma cylindrosporum]|uniref:Uncharacterized protein n=1 Tax=Hebeloma cylindrosporum TaxID=76867 RepID=A0A0C3BXG2_HEBCY|nr:hypothetical protein M413DRAFT_20642 [Hebeloma cylindrosporum h7]